MAVAGLTTPSMADAHQRQLEAEGVDLPGDVDVLGVAGAPARDDGDVVEPVGPPARLADADLDLSHCSSLPLRDHCPKTAKESPEGPSPLERGKSTPGPRRSGADSRARSRASGTPNGRPREARG